MNRLEKKALTQINSVNEISLAGILGKLFFSGKAKRLFKTIDKDIKKDPELKAAFIDMHRHQEKINDLVKSLCDRKPDSPACKKRAKRIRKGW